MYGDKTLADLRDAGFAVLVYTPENSAQMTEILRKHPPSWIDVESRADLMTWMEGTIEEALDVAEAGFGAESEAQIDYQHCDSCQEVRSIDDFSLSKDSKHTLTEGEVCDYCFGDFYDAETFGAEYDVECITCASDMSDQPLWTCECCGFLVGTKGEHEGCGFNEYGEVMCNLCYTGQCDCYETSDAETFESQYAGGFGSGSLNDVGLSSNQLTSTWGSGDFDSASLNSSGHQNVFARAEGETHSHAPHDYYTPVGPSDTPDVSGYLSHDDRMDIDSFMAEGDSEWTTFIGHKQRKARNPNYDASTSFMSPKLDYTCTCGMTCEICNKNTGLCGKDGIMYSPSENLVACSGCRSSSKSAESVGFAAEYDGPSTLSSALSGARKTDKNGRHLTIVQRLVAKYGIEKGVKIYKHFGIKQKRASPKVRGKVRGTKSGPRRYSEGRVGGAGRSQVYQNGDRTGSWTKSGGYTTSYANSGKAWYQERGYGTPVMGPVPDTALAGKALGEKSRGKFVNPAGIVGYPFVPAQQREQKR